MNKTNKSQRGFVPAIVVLILAAIALAGGAYTYEKKKEESKEKSKQTVSELDASKDTNKENDGAKSGASINTNTSINSKIKVDDIKVGGSKEDKDEIDSDRDDEEGDDDGVVATPVTTKNNSTATPTPTATYTLTQVKTHNTASNCWTTINGSVYNVTPWINQHPGGAQAIISLCGIDGSAAFNGQHGGQARPASELASFKIGSLVK